VVTGVAALLQLQWGPQGWGALTVRAAARRTVAVVVVVVVPLLLLLLLLLSAVVGLLSL
jgi:hypothetical protein